MSERLVFRSATIVALLHAVDDAFVNVAVVAGVVLAFVVVIPVAVAIVATHKYREPIGAPPSAAYRPVTFAARDGVKLSGW